MQSNTDGLIIAHNALHRKLFMRQAHSHVSLILVLHVNDGGLEVGDWVGALLGRLERILRLDSDGVRYV